MATNGGNVWPSACSWNVKVSGTLLARCQLLELALRQLGRAQLLCVITEGAWPIIVPIIFIMQSRHQLIWRRLRGFMSHLDNANGF